MVTIGCHHLEKISDAGYEIAVECAKEKGLDLPGILG